MPRKKKQDVKVNNAESLEGIMQETYNDACLNISDAQKTINELSASAIPIDVDDHTKIAKTKIDALKIKDSSIRIKLEIAKLQSDIIKNRGDVDSTVIERSEGSGSLKDGFKSIREMLKKDKSGENNEETETE